MVKKIKARLDVLYKEQAHLVDIKRVWVKPENGFSYREQLMINTELIKELEDLLDDDIKLEYQEAKLVIEDYEAEQDRLDEVLVDFSEDLRNYFKTTYIKSFNINIESVGMIKKYYTIYPTNPTFDEDYGGEFDYNINKIALKHKINAGISSDCYGK